MVTTILCLGQLADGLVLAPERYDPRRHLVDSGTTRLRDIAALALNVTAEARGSPAGYVVLNTGDANEGFLTASPKAGWSAHLGSAKKIVRPGDVVISRLRPYLRQVAYLDKDFWQEVQEGAKVVCSTEFYVLRSASSNSIGFLVPFLLSNDVQTALAAAQEGGHHPRFNAETLLDLTLPERILRSQEEVSTSVMESTVKFRSALRDMHNLTEASTSDSGQHTEASA